ncbi:MAG: DUF3568 family protein [Syntrophaceae bacterium]
MKLRMVSVLLLVGVCLFSGCTLLVMGGAAVGGAAGAYVWVNDELKTDYYAPFDKTWTAVEKTVAGLHGTKVEPVREISQGTINTLIDDEKVRIAVTYKERNVTTVAIRVGTVGNKLSSQLIHDRIAENLKK